MHTKTAVINSRTHSKTSQVWRRRQCAKCGKIFTTYERVSTGDELSCQTISGNKVAYSFGQLLLDIAACFDHAPNKRADKAYWLAKTVEDQLLASGRTNLTTKLIAKTTHRAMLPFDNFAAVQFAARHNKLV